MLHTDKTVRAKVTWLKKDKYKEARSCSEEMSLEWSKINKINNLQHGSPCVFGSGGDIRIKSLVYQAT